MTKRLVDIDDEALERTREALGTKTLKDTGQRLPGGDGQSRPPAGDHTRGRTTLCGGNRRSAGSGGHGEGLGVTHARWLVDNSAWPGWTGVRSRASSSRA